MKKTLLPLTLLLLLATAVVSFRPFTVAARQGADIVYEWTNDIVRQPNDPPYYSLHYRLRMMYFSLQRQTDRPVVFLGDSITYGGDWPKLFPDTQVVNRGIGGDTTLGLLNRLDEIIALEPTKIFLMIGTNDLCYGRQIPQIISNYSHILERLRRELPATEVYVQNVLPFNETLFPSRGLRTNGEIVRLNREIARMAGVYRYPYVEVAAPFTGADGRLPARYTSDGLHLSEAGYLLWREQISSLVTQSKGLRQ